VILVTGATGLNGSAILREFSRRGVPVRGLVRNRAKAHALESLPGVELVEGDMSRSETLGAALRSIDRVLMISSADSQLVQTQCAFTDAAKHAGVRHIVKYSGLNAHPGSPFRFARMHGEIERYMETSGVTWTHLRPSQFMQMYFREVPAIAAKGAFFLPMGEARIAPVDVEDIAKVAFALLQSDGHEGRIYDMTGPEALTMSEVAERIAQVIGKPVRYVDIEPAAKTRAMIEAGVPAAFAAAMEELFAERRKGSEAAVDLSTHEAFGVQPTTFAQFARRHAAVFRGEPAVATGAPA
jgi:uncharacterized protein YbjT (DUF2867 family)